MKISKNQICLYAIVCFSVTAFINSGIAQNNISGLVRYTDNNELVHSGLVRAFDLQGTLIASNAVNSDGTYLLAGLPEIELDIIGIADDELDNFLPTFYPDQIDPLFAQSILASGNLIHKDIYVGRTGGGNSPGGTASISGFVTLNGKPLRDAVIYARIDRDYKSFSISSGDGAYSVRNLSEGDYILIVHRIGNVSKSIRIHVAPNGVEGVNFEMTALHQNEISANQPSGSVTLFQNYPNPFNPSTLISYALPLSGGVTLRIYNIGGQVVNELVNRFQNAGTYTIVFDAANLASGTYFYKLQSNGYNQTRRMTVIK